ERIVDIFESIEVQDENRKPLTARPQTAQALLQPLAQYCPVGDTGQGVLPGQLNNPLLRTLAFRHVVDNGNQILRLPIFVADCEPSANDGAYAVARRLKLALL